MSVCRNTGKPNHNPFVLTVCICVMLFLIIAPAPGTMSAPLPGRDLTGTNMEGINHWAAFSGTAQDCANLCDATTGCAGAVYVPPNSGQGDVAHCWRKSTVTGDVELLSVTSYKKLASVIVGCILSNPSASFSTLPERHSGVVPFTVQFKDTSTGAKSWHWDFGDGTSSDLQNPDHTFTGGSVRGTGYAVTLTVTGSCSGESNTDTMQVTAYDNIGFFDVRSTPPGAWVTFNGREISAKTPLSADEAIPVGSYPLILRMEGYDDYMTLVTITKGQMTHVDVTLVKKTSEDGTGGSVPLSVSRTAGSLRILSAPDGAVVTVDGGAQGATPVTVDGLSAGTHIVTLKKSGYADYRQTLTVTAGKVTEIDVNLVAGVQDPDTGLTSATRTSQPSGTGSVAVVSSPSGAAVSLDGSGEGTTPLTIPGVKAGSHTLMVRKSGYRDSAASITVTAEMNTSVSLTLVQESGGTDSGSTGTGTITLRSDPPGAEVIVDGGRVGATPLMLQNVPAGTHTILLTLRNYNDYRQDVTISDRSDKEISVSLTTTKRAPGFSLPAVLVAISCIGLAGIRRRKIRE